MTAPAGRVLAIVGPMIGNARNRRYQWEVVATMWPDREEADRYTARVWVRGVTNLQRTRRLTRAILALEERFGEGTVHLESFIPRPAMHEPLRAQFFITPTKLPEHFR